MKRYSTSYVIKIMRYHCTPIGYSNVPSMVTSVSVSGHAQISGLVLLFPPLSYIPGKSHSQWVTLTSPHPPNTGKTEVSFYSSSFLAPFFWKAAKMFKLFWTSFFFPSLILFSISVVTSAAGKSSPWSKAFHHDLQVWLGPLLHLLHTCKFVLSLLKEGWVGLRA